MILQALFLSLVTLSSGASSSYQYAMQVTTSASYTISFNNDTFVKNDIEFTFKCSYNDDENYQLELMRYEVTSYSYDDEGELRNSSNDYYNFSTYLILDPYSDQIQINDSVQGNELDLQFVFGSSNHTLTTQPMYISGASMVSNFDPAVKFENIEWSTIIRSSNSYSSGQADYQRGYNDGFTEGQQGGYQQGYADGYTEGATQDETAVVIFTGILNVALLPINMFLQIFNFEVFGINIGGLVSAFLTVAIVVIIIRIITGKKSE